MADMYGRGAIFRHTTSRMRRFRCEASRSANCLTTRHGPGPARVLGPLPWVSGGNRHHLPSPRWRGGAPCANLTFREKVNATVLDLDAVYASRRGGFRPR